MALPKNILVVDDNPDVADTTAFLLQAYGFDVSVAYGGPEALAIARIIQPDLVFLDIGMPIMDGYEVARRLRADAKLCTVKLVAFTAWGDEASRLKVTAAGFNLHLTKPSSVTELIAAITMEIA